MNVHGARDFAGRVASSGGIAIIGMAGRFPGADSVDEFWKNICDGVDSISRFEPGELDDAFAADVRASAAYVPARPILNDVDQFDAEFFGMYPREAALTDPQHRVFLECAWEALESGGYDPGRYPGAIGVFAGCSMSTYFLNNVCGDRATVEDFTSNFQVGNYPMLVGAGQDFLATRVAYKLDLRGPAVTLGTACSTSLTAVVQACQSLLLRQSDMALAGGVSITFPQRRGYVHQQGGMVSKDGRCRPFDAEASGTVFGSGAAAVLLKRLDEALADCDRIHAVIRSAAANNDGARKVGFTAPSVDGQAQVVVNAQRLAGVDARSIGYVECHGTATPLGDPIEFTALVKAFSATTDDRRFCALGSVKGNVGHLDAAAGATGLIKAALVVRDGIIPPLANFSKPSPFVDLEHSPFYINDGLQPWPSTERPRRAGVTSLGVGGTNVHVVIEEAESFAGHGESEFVENRRSSVVLPVSARSPAALDRSISRLATHLEAHPELSLDDVAHTLQQGRRAFDHRAAIVCRDRLDAAVSSLRQTPIRGCARGKVPPIIFLVPGQGAQYTGMGKGLYDSEPLFRDLIDDGAKILEPLLGQDLRKLLYEESPIGTDPAEQLHATVHTQPALFLTAYAAARVWMSWGIEPAAMVGHSVGELVCATLADVFSFEDALGLIARRGRLMQNCQPGAMLAVRLSEAELRSQLPADVDIAAVNSPRSCVVSGPFGAIEALEKILAQKDVMHRRLQTSHAFHSAMMDPVVAALASHVETLTLEEARIPFVSGLDGRWIDPQDAISPRYWAKHCRACVRFSDALATAVDMPPPILLEVGPGRTLGGLALQCVPKTAVRDIIASLPDRSAEVDDSTAMMNAVGRLWVAGAEPLWTAIHGTGRHRVPLPTYPFERQIHWIEAPKPGQPDKAASKPNGGQPQPAVSLETNSVTEGNDVAATSSLRAPIPPVTMASRIPDIRGKIAAALEELSGDKIDETAAEMSFLELGFDSLFLAQLATRIQKSFGIEITFRQLLDDLSCVARLADYLDARMPRDAMPTPAPATEPVPALAVVSPVVETGAPAGDAPSGLQALFQSQLTTLQTLFAQQFQALRVSDSGDVVPLRQPAQAPPVVAVTPPIPPPSALEETGAGSRFQVYRAGASMAAAVTTLEQKTFIDDLVARYSARTPGSKRATQDHRAVLADPRAAAGFRREWKELVYPIVCARSKGSKIWDLDGNEYVDLVNGYGQTAFGHAPDFVLEAVSEQMAQGFAIGPQSPLAGEVASLISRLTGNERVTFCNTGSEAVMAAMRVARTVTGRDRIVIFGGAYHGQFDEVLVKALGRSATPGALPVAPGVPDTSVANMVVLPYGTPESLDWIRTHAGSVAAVIVEPVQSRHPAFLPRAFIEELRNITEASGSAFVFDEIVTGFRVHPGGMQALLGVRADLCTYGKVVGGGMPIGVLAGKPRFMDALDGGHWRYGDESFPEVAPTFFAGTFVRHPLVLAAARAVLKHLEAQGPTLQRELTARAAGLVDRFNAKLEQRGIATRAETFSSWFYVNFAGEGRLASLFFHHARLLGVHIQEGFPCFLTTAHDTGDIDHVVDVFGQSIDALQKAGILVPSTKLAVDTTPPPIIKDEVLPDAVPWTEPQQEIWMAAQLGNHASCAFNESISLECDGPLDDAALGEALNDVVARHDSLRGSFGRGSGTMHVAPHLTIDLPVLDLSASPDVPQALLDLIDMDARRAFDLADGPLFRALLVRLDESRHVFVLTAHHIICDGWSINVIVDEILTCYAARQSGRTPDLPAAPAFRRYAMEKAQPSEASRKAQAFWLNEYATLPNPLDLPPDRSRPIQKSFHGSTYRDRIDADLYRAAKATGGRLGCTLFATLLSTLQILVGRLAGQDDVVIAVPAAGQNLADLPGLVGHCVNLLPLRSRLDLGASAADHLRAIKGRILEAYENQDCTFGTIIRQLRVSRDPSRLPLTQIQFNLEKLAAGPQLPGLTLKTTPNGKAFSNFDLFINFIEAVDGIRIDCDYNTDLFDESTIARWIAHFRTLLAAIAADPSVPLSALPLLSPMERDWLTQGLNGTSTADFDLRPVHELVSARATETPDAVAAIWRDERLCYGELDARINRLARHIGNVVPTPAGRIAVAVSRSLDLVVGLLAVLKAGHAYVPLDPQQPATRQELIMGDAKVSVLICDSPAVAAKYSDLPVIDLLADAEQIEAQSSAPPSSAETSLDASAYVIFTSGSTGRPKGVEIAHRSLTNLLWSMARRPGFAAADRLLAVTTISFDIAAAELFLPLITGGSLVIADRDEVIDGFELVERIGTSGATVVQATPSLWRMLIEAGFRSRPGLTMLCGGEPLPRDLADLLLEGGGALWNAYGPTETCIWSSIGRVEPQPLPITVGTPLLNTQFHVLDGNDRLLPVGVVGELFIGGSGLAKGYFERDDLTAQAFREVVLPGAGLQRLYRTGDRAKRLHDGTVQLLGRNDTQIKLRGFRIELEEVEAILRRCPGVRAAAASLTTTANGEARLVGYFVPTAESSVTPAQLAGHVAAHLPDYMVPSLWVGLDALPMTPNRKLDRGALPAVSSLAGPSPRRQQSPQTPLQGQLAKIVEDVLEIEHVGIEDNLFTIGADSLHLFRIAARIQAQGIALEARHVLQFPTIRTLAEAAATAESPDHDSRVPSLQAFRRSARPVAATVQ